MGDGVLPDLRPEGGEYATRLTDVVKKEAGKQRRSLEQALQRIFRMRIRIGTEARQRPAY